MNRIIVLYDKLGSINKFAMIIDRKIFPHSLRQYRCNISIKHRYQLQELFPDKHVGSIYHYKDTESKEEVISDIQKIKWDETYSAIYDKKYNIIGIKKTSISFIHDYSSRPKTLAQEHAAYIEKILKMYEDPDTLAKLIFHYKTAFIHGYKHALEDYGILTNKVKKNQSIEDYTTKLNSVKQLDKKEKKHD